MTSAHVTVSGETDASAARRHALALARQMEFDDHRSGTIALIATELATNVARHADRGEMLVQASSAGPPAIEVIAIDKGPGIGNVERALRDGFSTAGSLGHGLGIVSRQADEFDFYTHEKAGTVVLARVRRNADSNGSDARFSLGGVSVALEDEPVCGDDWAIRWRENQGELLVVDGLGHGIAASEAAIAATRAFRSSMAGSPDAIVEDLHLALRPTRGGALAVAAIHLDDEVLKYAGLGNISGLIITPTRKRVNLVSQNGTAGHVARRIQQFHYPFKTGSILVMFSDGLSATWDHESYADLWSHDPSLIAAVLYRDCSRRRDDATVVVLRA